MREFKLINATSIENAIDILNEYKGEAKILAGGTDLLGGLKRDIYEKYPKVVVNIQNIPDMDYIKEEGMLKIGAQTKLETIAENPLIKEKYRALAQAAIKTASPHLRAMGTIAGNICQDIRCWYYRGADNYFHCRLKGGKKCFAPLGDNRYHSIFGGSNGCMGVNPSDTAPAIIALDGKIITNKRIIEAQDFFAMSDSGSTVLDKDEIVIEIQIPILKEETKSTFIKFANRPTIDFPIVNCAVLVNDDDARICLNGVHPNPYRAIDAEKAIKGKNINEESAEAAGEAAIKGAKALSNNKYKIQIAKTLVKRGILACK